MKYVLLFSFVMLNYDANACDCDKIYGLDEAKAAFIGKVISVTRVDSDYRRNEVTFEVIKRIKRIKRKKDIVVDVPCLIDACCGIPFKEGDVYTVYAYESDNRLKTNLCWMPMPAKIK